MDTAITSMERDSEVLREATLADFQEVLDLAPDNYAGLDYLPATYPALIQGHGVKGFVYEKDGRVVGFRSTQLIDGGQTVLLMAGRLRQEYRGQGMFGRFTQRILDRFRAIPGVLYRTLAMDNTGMDGFGQRILTHTRVVMEKTLTSLHVDLAEARSPLVMIRTEHRIDLGLQVLTDHHVTTMLNQPPSNLHHLFPQGRILLEWHPYRIMAANVDHIKNGNHRMFVAKSAEVMAAGNEHGFPTIRLLSCGSHYICKRGINYDIDIFGDGSDEELRGHLEWHVHRLVKTAAKDIGVVKVFHSKNLDHMVPELQTQFPLQKLSLPFKKIFVLDSDLSKQF